MRTQSLAIVAPSPVPLRSGGAERLWDGLASAARRAGITVDVIKLPVREQNLPDLIDGYAAFAALDLRHVDAVITGKYPAIAVDHPHHVVWMLHPLRGLYDRWPEHLNDAWRSYQAGRSDQSGRSDQARRLPARLGDALQRAAGLTAHTSSFAAPLAEIAGLLRAHRDEAGPDDPHLQIPSVFARDLVQRIDRACLSPRRVSTHAAISREVAARPGYFPPEANPKVLYPPLVLVDPAPSNTAPSNTAPSNTAPSNSASRRAESAQLPQAPAGRLQDEQTTDSAGSEDVGAAVARPDDRVRTPLQVLVAGRLEQAKRVDLAIDAVRLAADDGCDIALTIVGTGDDESRIRSLAERANEGRHHPIVSLAGRVSDAELADWYRQSDVYLFTPPHEDFGYVALEALAAGTPVLAPIDGGGAVELIDDQVNGWVADATARAFADRLVVVAALSAQERAELGAAAQASAARVDWAATVDSLLSDTERPRREVPKVVAVSTYPIHQRGQGGPERVWNLLRAVATRGAEVEVISLTADPSLSGRFALAERFHETAIPHSRRHADAETHIRLVTGPIAVSDIGAGLLWPATPDFTRELSNALADADAVVLVHPFLISAVMALRPDGLPIVLDAHNHETRMKSEMLPKNEAGDWLAGHTQRFERAAIRAASVVTPTTETDADALANDFAEPGADTPTFEVIPNGATIGRSTEPHVDPTRRSNTDSAGTYHTASDAERAAARTRIQTLVEIPDGSPIAIFVGSGHPPNIDAGQRILDVAALLPDVTFLLVGRHSELLRPNSHQPNVHLMGRVDESEWHDALAASDVALNPMTSGSGSNLKLVAYFAAGVPAVTTAIGARGIDEPETYAEICGPDPRELADAVTKVLSPEGQPVAQLRAVAARMMVSDTLDWRTLGSRFATLVLDEADKFRATHGAP